MYRLSMISMHAVLTKLKVNVVRNALIHYAGNNKIYNTVANVLAICHAGEVYIAVHASCIYIVLCLYVLPTLWLYIYIYIYSYICTYIPILKLSTMCLSCRK